MRKPEFAGAREPMIAEFLPNPLVINGLVGQIVGLLFVRNPG